MINLGSWPERGTSIRNEERVSGTRNEYSERGTSIRNEERVSGTRNEYPEQGTSIRNEEGVSGTRNEYPERGTRIAPCIVPSSIFRPPREEVSEVLSFREPERL